MCEQSWSGEILGERALTPTPKTFPASPSLPKEPSVLGWDSLSGHEMFSTWASPCKVRLLLLDMKDNEDQTCFSAVYN